MYRAEPRRQIFCLTPIEQGAAEQWKTHGNVPECVYWSENSNDWRVDGVVLGSIDHGMDGVSTVTCWTYHLSPFAIVNEEAPSGTWGNFRQLVGIGLLKEVRHLHR